MSILDKIERALFGASAAETVELRLRLAELRIEQKIIEAIEALDDEGEEDDPASESAVPESDEDGYWVRRPDGGLHYHAYDPVTEDDEAVAESH